MAWPLSICMFNLSEVMGYLNQIKEIPTNGPTTSLVTGGGRISRTCCFFRLRDKSTVNTSEEGAAMPCFRNLNPWRITAPVQTAGDYVSATPFFFKSESSFAKPFALLSVTFLSTEPKWSHLSGLLDYSIFSRTSPWRGFTSMIPSSNVAFFTGPLLRQSLLTARLWRGFPSFFLPVFTCCLTRKLSST